MDDFLKLLLLAFLVAPLFAALAFLFQNIAWKRRLSLRNLEAEEVAGADRPVFDIIEALRASDLTLTSLSPREFRALVAELLAGLGWQVSIAPASDPFLDVIATMTDKTGLEIFWAVKCFNGRSPVDINTVSDVFSLGRHLGMQALVVATSGLTPEASRLAKDLRMSPVGEEKLHKWISEYLPPRTDHTYSRAQSFFSCFISYSHKDELFAGRLATRLRMAGIKVWFAPEDLPLGVRMSEAIGKAIHDFDRFLLVLSDHSMSSRWVGTELKRARQREVDEQGQILFPVALVPFERIKNWELFDADLGDDLSSAVRQYPIADFSNWQDEREFDYQTGRIVAALRR